MIEEEEEEEEENGEESKISRFHTSELSSSKTVLMEVRSLFTVIRDVARME